MDKLRKYLNAYVNDPLDPYVNAQLGEEYELIGQGAAALSYFLRAAELLHDKDPEMTYCCLLKTWKQLHKTTRRLEWEKGQLQTAVAYFPDRPEAYLHLSLHHSKKQEWKDSYMYACLGLLHQNKSPLPYNVGYPGDYMLLFQKAFTSWYIGQRQESKELWTKLGGMKNILPEHMEIIQHNIKTLGKDTETSSEINFKLSSGETLTTKKYSIIK
jgi:tetratricopeptide (TPR) repeat protein